MRSFNPIAFVRVLPRLVARLSLVFAVLIGGCLRAATQSTVSSVYTDLAGSNCTPVSETKETGATVHRCNGVAGWKLLVLYDDERMSVTAVAPDGKQSPLAYWDTISRGFTSLGMVAEWRLRQSGNQDATPVALIVRVNASETKDGGRQTRTSYLAVAKISEAGACVTRRIDPAADANDRARRAADEALQAPCLMAKN